MSEPAVIQTLAAWLETAGPKRCITWIAETCDEIAIRDTPTWRFWIEMGSLFRDIAAALPTYNENAARNGADQSWRGRAHRPRWPRRR
jgi:hypothetical protein